MKNIFLNERIVLFTIILNTLFMFFCGFWPTESSLEFIDIIFTIFFVLEAIIKISSFGWSKYWQDDWNRFDFVILIVALPSLFELIIDEQLPINALFALRSLRVFKSFKLFRFVPNISQLLQGIKLAMKSSLLVCVAYIVFLLVFSILTSSIFGKYAPQYFGNPLLSMYSVFRLFTIEGWYEMPDAIIQSGGEAIGIVARIYFAVLLFAGGIIGMSLINSIFVDAMATDNNDEVLAKLEKIESEIQKLNKK